MPNYTNIATLEVLTQDDFSALVCTKEFTCCDYSDSVWFTNNEAKNEYEWQQFFLANNLCSDGNAPVNVIPPVISGTIGVGNVLTSTTGTWTSDSAITYSYQWILDGGDIFGETNSTYTIQSGDVDGKITCKVTACDSDGCNSVESNLLDIATIPTNSVLPSISGNLVVGSVLTSSTGTWSAVGTIGYTYQWKRNGSNIVFQTSSTYTLVQADAGQTITCEVTATTVVGSANATSAGSYILDADYNAVLSRGTALGYTLPDATLQVKQNATVISLKSAGIWNKLDILRFYATNNSNMATLNFKNPSAHQSILVNSPLFTTNQGFKGNASTSYINENFNPATHGVQYTLNNASRFIYLKTAFVTPTMYILDNVLGASQNMMQNRNSNDQKINQAGNVISSNADLSGAGLKVINRTSSTNVELFNGSTQISRTATSTSVNSGNQWVLPSGCDACASVYAMGASLVGEHAQLKIILDTYVNSL
jgi:hypothetical protein